MLAGEAFCDAEHHGPWKRRYANGQLWDRGAYDRGKKTGHWETFAEDGSLKHAKDH